MSALHQPIGFNFCLVSLLVLVMAAAGAASESEAPAGANEVAAWPTLPAIRLARLSEEAANDEAALADALEQAAELERRSHEALPPLERADAAVAAANLLLASGVEPHCSRSLAQLSEVPVEDPRLHQLFDRAEQLLRRARDELAKLSEDGEAPPDQSQPVMERWEVVSNFAGALRSYLLGTLAQPAGSGPRRAASLLSPLLEHRDPRIAGAADLWQAVLRAHGSDPARALPLLDPALSEPKPGTLPYSFYARILRCRLVAAGGGYAASLGLLYQLEERCRFWFEKVQDREDALRLVTLTELHVLRRWHDSLGPSLPEERSWCRERANRLVKDRFGGENPTILRLGRAFPLLGESDFSPQASPPPTDDTR